MAVKMLGGAALAVMLTVAGAQSQSLAQIGGPANLPPRSFKGQQFVDSRGCLFLRAGFGGSVTWVARVDRNRTPICGMAPTGADTAQAALAADMAPDPPAAPQPRAAAASAAETAGTAPRPSGFSLGRLFGLGSNQAQPSPAPAPTVFRVAQTPATPPNDGPPGQTAVATYQGASVATSVEGVRCYATAPKLERVTVSGGTALVCTRGDGTVTGWRPPAVTQTSPAQVAALAAVPVTAAPALPKPPKGWAYAWKDDRLNPMRGIGTPQGQAQQDQVWTRTVPMVLVSDLSHGIKAAPTQRVRTVTSTATDPALAAQAQRPAALRVQVGSFGVPANADAAARKLAALGLPVSTTPVTHKGKALLIVSAGPFGSTEAARAGLVALQSAGFADAFLR